MPSFGGFTGKPAAPVASRPRRVGLAPDSLSQLSFTPPTGDVPALDPSTAPRPGTGEVPIAPELLSRLSFAPPTSEVPTLDQSTAPRPQRVLSELERAFTAQTPDEQSYQDLRQRGPAVPEPGFRNRINGMLISGGLAAREAGNQNPLGQAAALIGGLVGAGISPRFHASMRHNLVDIPRARGLAGESRELADASLGRRMGFARSFGYDPTSGTPTAETERYEQERTFRDKQAQLKQIGDYIEKLLGSHVPIPGGLARRAGQPELEGVRAPFAPTPPSWHPDENRNYVNLNAVPPGVRVRGPDPNAVTTYQKERLRLEAQRVQQGGKLTTYQQTQLDRQEKQEAAALDREGHALKGQFEAAKEKLTNLDREKNELWKATGQKPDKGFIRYRGKYYTPEELMSMAEQKETEWNAARAEFDGLKQAVGEHPTLEFDKSGVGVIFKSARSRSGVGNNTPKDPRIGKVFMHTDGKKYRITGIDKDGDPIGEPIQ